MKALGEAPPPLEFDNFDDAEEEAAAAKGMENGVVEETGAGVGTGAGAGAGDEDAEMAEGGEGTEGEEDGKGGEEMEEMGKKAGKEKERRRPPKGEEFEWVWKVCDLFPSLFVVN